VSQKVREFPRPGGPVDRLSATARSRLSSCPPT